MSENEPKRVEEQPDEQGGQGRCSGKAENIHRWVRLGAQCCHNCSPLSFGVGSFPRINMDSRY